MARDNSADAVSVQALRGIAGQRAVGAVILDELFKLREQWHTEWGPLATHFSTWSR